LRIDVEVPIGRDEAESRNSGEAAEEHARQQLTEHSGLPEPTGEMPTDERGRDDHRESKRQPSEFVNLRRTVAGRQKSRCKQRCADSDCNEMDGRVAPHGPSMHYVGNVRLIKRNRR
jgi:hypothetical protein